MSMGSMVFTVTLTPSNGGRHTQYVDFRDNPIRFAADLVAAIVARQDEFDSADLHPLAGAERIDLGILQAGDYFNRTPVSCRFTGTRRWSPGQSADETTFKKSIEGRSHYSDSGKCLHHAPPSAVTGMDGRRVWVQSSETR